MLLEFQVNRIMNFNAFTVASISAFLGGAFAAFASDTLVYRIELDPDGHARKDTPIVADLPLPETLGEDVRFTCEMTGPRGFSDGRKIQIERIEIDGTAFARVFWIQPEIRTGRVRTYRLSLKPDEGTPDTSGFRFVEGNGYRDLRYDERPVTRHMTGYNPDSHERTFKTFHHIHAFRNDGFITKGHGGLYSHHRGVFLGWNQTRIGGQTWDFWRGSGGETQRHREYFPERELLGAVVARDASRTDWMDPENNIVAHDIREITTWRIDENTILLDFDIQLHKEDTAVRLDGDAHQAGFQFRASQQVAAHQASNLFVRPKSATALSDDIWTDAPWVAGIFTVDRSRYSIFHANHPGNPAPTHYSTRAYGRFGAFFTAELDDGSPLYLHYRIVVKKAGAIEDTSHDYFAGLYTDFVNPVKVSVTPEQ